MAFPKITDLVTYINKKLTGNDWNTNWQKIVNWLSLGTTDIKINKIEANEIENSGTFTQNGNLIADNIQADSVTANSFVGDGSQLDNITVENIFAYTPFSVNSAQANFIVNDTTKLTFNVDDGTLYKPLIVTTARGEQIKITSINDYDVSGLNGTYYIFVDEETNGGTVYLKSCTIFRQVSVPTGQNGDVWLDTSNEPFVCRERVSNNWYSDEYNKVPIGKVVVSGGSITSLDILPFNQNGFNVDMGTDVIGVTASAIESRSTGVAGTSYRDAIYPTLVTFGDVVGSAHFNWNYKLQVSTDNSTWKTLASAEQLDGGMVNTLIIGAGLYWKFTTSLSSYTLYYSQIKGIGGK